MATEIEARRLNGTDLGKTISFPETEGSLRMVLHGYYDPDLADANRYVTVIVNDENHTLAPSDKVTLAGKKANE